MRKPRPQALIDALEPRERKAFAGTAWRVVSEGRDPLAGYRSGGRWDDGTFDVLYTSLTRDGAIAESVFHMRRGQPIIPSKPAKRLYSITVDLQHVLELGSLQDLRSLNVDTSKYGQLSYAQRATEYPSLQEIGEVAHFLAFEAILIPNARWDCHNLVVFTERCKPGAIDISDGGFVVDLNDWYRRNK